MNKIVFLIIVSFSQTSFGFSCKDSWDLPCKQRPGAKYKHSQCYDPRDPTFHYTCLNRNNIDESVIANTKIYENKPSNRVNYFKYFPKHKQNDTHIMCGNDSLEKKCGGGVNWNKIVHCKKGASDTIGKQISQRDVCNDFHFASTNNFTNMGFKSNCKYLILTKCLWQYHPKWKHPKWKFSTFCGLPGTTCYPYLLLRTIDPLTPLATHRVGSKPTHWQIY